MDTPGRAMRTIHRMVRQATMGGDRMKDILRADEPRSGSELAARSAAASEAEPHQYRPPSMRSRETLTDRLERVLWSVTYWLARARGGSRDER